jgi:hypothetical protein
VTHVVNRNYKLEGFIGATSNPRTNSDSKHL